MAVLLKSKNDPLNLCYETLRFEFSDEFRRNQKNGSEDPPLQLWAEAVEA